MDENDAKVDGSSYRVMTDDQAAEAFGNEGGLVCIPYSCRSEVEHVTKERGERIQQALRDRVPIVQIAAALDELRTKCIATAAQVYNERIRQNVKFTKSPVGVQRHTATDWSSLLAEECGEAAQALNDLYFRGGEAQDEAAFKQLAAHAREELVQAAALCFATIERLDAFDAALVSRDITNHDTPPRPA